MNQALKRRTALQAESAALGEMRARDHALGHPEPAGYGLGIEAGPVDEGAVDAHRHHQEQLGRALSPSWARCRKEQCNGRTCRCKNNVHSFYISLTMPSPDFEYDEHKCASNRAKHGIDFEEPQELWRDPALVEIPARATDERRWLVVAKRGAAHWSAVITRRGERIRLISVRRSRAEEAELYESDQL